MLMELLCFHLKKNNFLNEGISNKKTKNKETNSVQNVLEES
jgi:hypothetical protein